MAGISPFLWFDDDALEAAEFYVSVFENSHITSVTRYGPGGPQPAGSVMSVDFTLRGLDLHALNGGPGFPFTEAVSLFAQAPTQERIDHYWSRLLEGGGLEGQCGWVRDRFGLWWQVVPPILLEWLSDADTAAAGRTMAAMMHMTKLDLETLRAAHAGT